MHRALDVKLQILSVSATVHLTGNPCCALSECTAPRIPGLADVHMRLWASPLAYQPTYLFGTWSPLHRVSTERVLVSYNKGGVEWMLLLLCRKESPDEQKA
jgi:hypothetical protein